MRVEEIMRQMAYSLDQTEAIDILREYVEVEDLTDEDYQTLHEVALQLLQRGYIEAGEYLWLQLYHHTQRPEYALALAELYYKYQSLDTALLWLQQIPTAGLSPSLDQAKSYLSAEIYQAKGQGRAALKELNQLIRTYPRYYPAYALALEIHHDLGNSKDVETFLYTIETYFSDEMDIAEFKTLQVQYLLAQETINFPAIYDILESDAYPQDDAEALYLAAEVYVMAENYLLAEAKVDQSIALQPNYVDAHLLRLEIYQALENLSGIETELTWLTRTLPMDEPEVLTLVDIADEFALFTPELGALFEDHLLLMEDVEQLYSYLKLYVRQVGQIGDTDQAERLLHQVAPEQLTEGQLQYLLARLYKGTQRSEQAVDSYAYALSELLAEPSLVLELGELYIQQGEVAKAKDLLEQFNGTDYETEPLAQKIQEVERK